jgi:hypothetical protein
MYSPTKPSESNCIPAKKLINITVVDRPGVNENPRSFWSAYQPPVRKLNAAMQAPNIDITFNGFAENPIKPFSPIRIDPK